MKTHRLATRVIALLVVAGIAMPSPALALRLSQEEAKPGTSVLRVEEVSETDVLTNLRRAIVRVARDAGLTPPPSTIPASPASQQTAVPMPSVPASTTAAFRADGPIRPGAGLEEGGEAGRWIASLLSSFWNESELPQLGDAFEGIRQDFDLLQPETNRQVIHAFAQDHGLESISKIALWGWYIATLWGAQEREETISVFQEEVMPLIRSAEVESWWIGFGHFVLGLMVLETWESTNEAGWLQEAQTQLVRGNEFIGGGHESLDFHRPYFTYQAMVQYLQGETVLARRAIEHIQDWQRDLPTLAVAMAVVTGLDLESWLEGRGAATRVAEDLDRWESVEPGPRGRPHVLALAEHLFERLDGRTEPEARGWRRRINALYDRWSSAGLEEGEISEELKVKSEELGVQPSVATAVPFSTLNSSLLTASPAAGLEEWESDMKRDLRQLGFGEAVERLTTRDLQSLRANPDYLQLYLQALDVSIDATARDQLVRGLEPWRYLPRHFPSDIDVLLKQTLPQSVTEEQFLSNLKTAEQAIEQYLASVRPSAKEDRPHPLRYLIERSHTTDELELLRNVARRLIVALDPDAPEAEVEAEVKFLVGVTKSASMRAIVERFQELGAPFGDLFKSSFSRAVREILSWSFFLRAEGSDVRLVVLSTSEAGGLPHARLAALAAHEYGHGLIARRSLVKWNPDELKSSHEDWITNAFSGIIAEQESTDPLGWGMGGSMGPTLTHWLYAKEGRRLARQSTSTWSQTLERGYAVPPDMQVYVQGLVMGGIAREIGQEVVDHDPQYNPAERALRLVGVYATEAEAPVLEEFVRIARQFRKEHGLTEEHPAAGLEERGRQGWAGWRPSRRTFITAGVAAMVGGGALGWWLTRDGGEDFLPVEQVPAPWSSFFEPQPGENAIPYLGEDYLRFQIRRGQFGGSFLAFDSNGRELGDVDATSGRYQRLVDPRTGETLGYYRGVLQWHPNLGVQRFDVLDRYGNSTLKVTDYPYVEGKRLPGVPFGWRNPESPEFGQEGATVPLYQVFQDEEGDWSRVEQIGFVQTYSDRPGRLLDNRKRPIAILEPINIVSTEQDPRTFRDSALVSTRSLTGHYFGAPPSQALAEELTRALDQFQPETPDGRKAKLQLAHRWLQVQVLLGNRQVAVDPRQARKAGEALVGRTPNELNRLEDPQIRSLLWDSLGNLHPWFALTREAVQHLGWEEDPEILRYVLAELQRWWIRLDDSHRRRLGAEGRMTILTQKVLEEAVLYNGLLTFEEVVDGFQVFLSESSELSSGFLYIDRPEGSDPDVMPMSLMEARLKGYHNVSDVQVLLAQAVALQRLGHEVSLISFVPVEKRLEGPEDTKTLSHEWMVMAVAPDNPQEATLHSLHRDFLKQFGPEIAPGVVRVREKELEEKLKTLPKGTFLALENYALFPLDARSYLQARDQAAQQEPDRIHSNNPELLAEGLGIASHPGVALHRQYERDLALVYVQEMSRRFDQITKDLGIVVDTGSLRGDELEVRKAGFGAALGLIPRKLIGDLKKITFVANPPLVPFREAIVQDGRVTWRMTTVRAEGTYLGNEIEVVGGVTAPIHELVHHWDMSVTDKVRDWRGDLSELFYQISWQKRRSGEWRPRKTTGVDMRDFRNQTHGLANQLEDIAVTGERYAMKAVRFRQDVRFAMEEGNFIPAVKYLFSKYLLFLDTDGVSFEYSVSPRNTAISFEEVFNKMKLKATGPNADPEVKRLWELTGKMQEVWRKQRESGDIVQSKTVPAVPAAGLEEDFQNLARRWELANRSEHHVVAVSGVSEAEGLLDRPISIGNITLVAVPEEVDGMEDLLMELFEKSGNRRTIVQGFGSQEEDRLKLFLLIARRMQLDVREITFKEDQVFRVYFRQLVFNLSGITPTANELVTLEKLLARLQAA